MHVFRFDPVQAIGCQFVGGVVQFGGQFDSGGTGADDGHADLFDFVGLSGVGAQVVVEQLLVEALGLLAGVEEQAMFGRTTGAEVIGGAAHGNHQGVVAQRARRHQLLAIFIQGCRNEDLLGGTVQPAHASQLKLEMIPFGLGHVVQFVFGRVQ
ncbi:hypothetical protein D3C80_1634120 [compost metagenome]